MTNQPDEKKIEAAIEAKLRDIDARKRELEKIINERQERISERMSAFKDEVEDRLTPERLIRKFPVTAIALAFGTGWLIARVLKGGGSKAATNIVLRERIADDGTVSQQVVSQKPGFAAQFAAELFDVGKNFAVNFISQKLQQVLTAPSAPPAPAPPPVERNENGHSGNPVNPDKA